MNVNDYVNHYHRIITERKRRKSVFYNGPWKDGFYDHVGDRMRRSYAYSISENNYFYAVGAEAELHVLDRASQYTWVYGLRKHGKYIVHGPAMAFHRRKQGW